MRPDLLVEDSDGNRHVWLASSTPTSNRTFTLLPFANSSGMPQFRVPHSHAFLDVNHDMTAGRCAVTGCAEHW